MTKLFEGKITKLRNSLFPNDHLISGQDLIQDNLLQIHSLVDEIWRSDSSSKLELLTNLDKELYKNLIIRLIHQRTNNIENLRCVLFKDLGSLYTQIGDLQKESANLNQGLKCYTEAAIFYQHSLHAMLRGYIKDQDTEIYQQLESIQQKILLSINSDSPIKFNDFNSESVKNSSQAKKEFLIKLRSNTRIKLDKFKTCYSKEEYNNSIQKLFTEITGDMSGLLKSLYEEADRELQQKLGLEAPCEYTIVGLGSMALNQITPYSDLEFAIIIKKFTPEIVQYFRNLSHLVHFKCINIGETIIPTSKYGIDMSSLGKQGVNFDLGGKTPLGRINGDKVYDLIGTVEHLMNYVKSTSSTDESLPFILENICLVKGSKSLVNEYKNAMQVFLKESYSGCEKKYQNKGLKNHQVKALKVLTEEIKEFDYKDPLKIMTYNSDLEKLTPIFKTADEGSLLDVKQEIYRLPDRMIYDLGMYLGIIGNSAWDTVNQLLEKKIISETGAKNLKNAISFATSLRLKSYDQSGSQTGMISTYIPALEHLKKQEKDKIVKTMFHIEDRKDLYDFFYVMMDFVDIIYFIAFPELQLQEQAPCILKKSNLLDDSNYSKAKVHAKFLDYDKALIYFKEAAKKHPNQLFLHEDLYNLCRKIGEIDEGLKTAENILVLNKKKYQNKIHHPYIAGDYNNLALVHANRGEYDLAIEHHKKALKIRLKAYASSPNHPDIANSYNNLALVCIQKEEYDKALQYALKSSNNTLIDIICLQLGNNSFLSQDLENAQKYYEQIDPKLSTSSQECLSIIQFKYIDIIYEANLLSAGINCQKVLIKIDPELKYRNHYHNLACFSACQGNIEEANQAFIDGLNHKNAKTTAGLYAEYAQFLLLNKDNDILNINNDTITKYLYRAINCDNIGGLGYGKIEQNTVCDILQSLIKEKNTTIIIHPKILAYYLLITNPEYIKEDDDVKTLLKSLDELCHTLYDTVSFKILANAYSFSGHEVLSEKYSEYAKIMDKLEAIIANTALLESNREILKSDIVKEFANNYYKLAYESLAKGFVGNSIKLFTKLFHIYEKKIIDNPESLQEIANSLFTLCYVKNNIQQYIDLKVQYNAELDLRILKLLNLDAEQIQNYEKQLLFQLSPLIEKQRKALEEKNKKITEIAKDNSSTEELSSSDSNNLYKDKEIISPVTASYAANNSIDCSISGNLEETIE